MQNALKILVVYPEQKEATRLQNLINQKFSADEVRIEPDREAAIKLGQEWQPDLVLYDPDYDLNRTDSRAIIYKTTISNSVTPEKSFYLKLIYKIPVKFESFVDSDSIPNFKRFTKIDNFSYFSKLDILTNSEFRKATDDLFIWQNSDNGELPLIYNFDLSFFKAKNRLEIKMPQIKGDFKLYLNEIDLIPLKKHAYLGFTLQGSSTTILDYLGFVSKKMFGKSYMLPTGNKSLDEYKITLKGLINAITKSLTCNNEIDLNLLSENSAGERPLMMHYLMLEKSLSEYNEDVLSGAVKLLGSFSRPNPDYPKTDPRIWQSKQALETIYTDFDYGTTAISASSDAFNRETKPTIFLKANYLQKIIAEEIKDRTTLEILKNCFTEKVRQEMFENLSEL